MPEQPLENDAEQLGAQESILYHANWNSESITPPEDSSESDQSSNFQNKTNGSLDQSHVPQKQADNSIERRQYLEHHLRSRPTDLESYMELGQLYRDTDRPADAKRILEQAVEVFPKNPQVHWELEEAILARSLQQYREVLEIAERIDTPEIDRELERSQNDWASRRIEVCQARLKRDPELYDLRLALGEAFLDVGRYEESIESVRELADQDIYSASASYLTGRCYLEIGRNHDAMKSLREVALRRAVPASPELKIAALQLLCTTADRLGVSRTLEIYQTQLEIAQSESQITR